jgi:hypothetical protein
MAAATAKHRSGYSADFVSAGLNSSCLKPFER